MSPRESPLADRHAAADVKTTTFNGWTMPVEYDGIQAEHAAVRSAAGRFDVSHMGQVAVAGPDAVALTQRLTTNDVSALDPGEGQYAAVTREDGAMIDDVVLYRTPWAREPGADEADPAGNSTADAAGESAADPATGSAAGAADASTIDATDRPLADVPAEVLVVPNAGNDERIADRWREHAATWNLDATVTNVTRDVAMIAVQGPEGRDAVDEACDRDLSDLDRFDVVSGRVAGVPALVARTGYTGEDGVEIVCDADSAGPVWDAVDCQRCGLGARDTLRLEMGFLLSGQDFHPSTNPRTPHEAGIEFVVDLETEFVGRDALEGVAVEGPDERLVGLRLVDRAIPREGYAVEDAEGNPLGTVTSGTLSPTLDVPIALAYLPAAYRTPDRRVRVVVRDEPKKARTATTPFLDE